LPGAIHALIVVAVCTVSGCRDEPAREPDPRPAQAIEKIQRFPGANLVLLSIDTLRRDHLPFYGYDRTTAPNLAQLAREGIVFEDAVAAHTQTAPSHASMMTGLHPGTHGILRNGMRLAADVRTLQEILRARGWRTAAFLSGWTLGRETGLDVGFEVYRSPLNRERRRRPADETWPEVESWLLGRKPPEEPFFLFVHLYDPHFRYAPPEEYALRFLPPGTQLRPVDRDEIREPDRYRSLDEEARRHYVARYDGEIAYADHYVGQLFRTLEELGVWDRTLVVFLSDHGETLFERERPADHGGRVYEEQVRIPLVIRLPRGEHGGRRIPVPVHHVDLLPTLLELLDLPTSEKFQGRSLVGSIAGEPDPPGGRPLYSQAESKPNRVPHISARLVRNELVWAIRLGRYKLIEYPTQHGVYLELFDLEEDPGETRNLASVDSERAARLGERLDRWRAEVRRGSAGPLPELDPETRSGLRALGYID
jgi:arylsulfatase A-like enzyme